MDSLNKIALIKSAKFDFNEIDLSGNSLFIGANGAGKTTLLRAILYFYTADMRSLGISNSKKISFGDYYFEYEHSYLVYVYKKDDKYVLVTVYKQSNNIRFRFCLLNTMPNIKEIFIVNNKPIEHGKLWIRLKELGILSNTLNSSEYKKTLYSKNTKLQYFSLFEAKEYDGFVKTLSNIFINNKVDSEAIKKVIVSSLDVDKKIDIEQIKRYLESFNTTYQDILTYTKQQKNITKLITILDNYEQTKNDIQDNFSTLANSKNIVVEEMKTLTEKNVSLKKNDKILDTQKIKQNELFFKREKKLNEYIGVLKQKIKQADTKTVFYQKEKIEEKLKKYNGLSVLNEELNNILKQREFLTKEHQELELSHQNQLQTINNSFATQKNNIKNSKIKLEFEIKQNILDNKSKLNDDIEDIKAKFSDEENNLKSKQNQTTLNIQEQKHKMLNVKKENFIFEYQDKLDSFEKEQISINKNIEHMRQSIVLKDNELLAYKENHSKDIENISQKEQYELKEIKLNITKIKKLINPNQNSLAYKIYNNKLDTDKYLYFLNDEILNSDITIDIKSQNNQLFELDILDFKAPKTSLTNSLQLLLKSLEHKQKEFEILIDNKSKELRNFENKIYRDKRELDKKIKKDEIIYTTCKTKISNLKNQSIILNDEFLKDNNAKLDKINSNLKILSNSLFEVKNKIEQQQKLKTTQINSLKSNSTKYINIAQNEYKIKIDILDLDLENLNIELKNKQNEQIQNFSDILKNKNIDVRKLQNLTVKQNELEKDIKTIQNYSSIINDYNYDKREYFNSYKITKSDLKEQNIELSKLLNNHKESIKEIDEKLSKIHSDLNQNNISLNEKENSIKRVEEFENSSSMIKYIGLGIKYTSNDSYNNIDTLLNNISNLTTLDSETQININSSIGKLNIIFDNSLNIKREIDFINTAYKIKEFEQNNTIVKYKDLLSTNLNQIIKNCIDEYNHLTIHSGKIESLVNKITKLFKQISIGVIDELSLRYSNSNNKVIEILSAIKDINEQNPFGFGLSLFNDITNSDEMINILKKLRDTIELDVVKSIELEDSFVLEFRVVENGNDSKYQTSLDMIGSNGTDVLVKSMIYIAMLHIFKSKSTKKEVAVNVILDEIGILSQRYLKELIEFANRYNIYFINGAPDEKLIGTYKRVSLVRNIDNHSIVQELISK